ncbi:MAG: ABC transporter substrate-binding protein [Actinomycetota bacterium]|nr:ABC transporter substrate-binding protein [Actinomycetota bacterium]
MRRRLFGRVVGIVLAIGLAVSCGNGTEPQQGGTLVLALLDDPRTLDPATTNQIVSFQVTYQMFETLVKLEPGGTRLVPGLARSWSSDDNGRMWTFQLREPVTFHDGTAFDAAAVCANFDRWYRFSGILQSPAISAIWQTVFGGFATRDLPSAPPTSLYESCAAPNPAEAVITLTRPSGAFLSALASPPFSMASPEALRRYEADKVTGSNEAPRFEGTFGTQHPVGTGPFRLQQWTPKDRLVLVRNEDYWGEKAKLDRVVFRYLPEGSARRQALETGEIGGYDPVDPPDIEPLRAAGFKVLERPAFNVGSLGINQTKPPLNRLEVRQAIAHALNRQALVRAKYPSGAVVAKELMPPTLWGYAEDVHQYSYDPARARQLLDQAGASGTSVELWYPTGVTDPIWVDTAGIAGAFQADLEAAGFEVTLRPAPLRPDYAAGVASGSAPLFLGVAYGDRSDPDAFLGRYQRTSPQLLGLDDPELFRLLDEAEAEPDQGRRQPLYEQANRRLMELVPAVPYVHVPVYIALADNVRGHPHAPVPWDPFSLITVD